MTQLFKEGDYVHIPAGVTGYSINDSGDIVSYFKSQEPLALMYLGSHTHSRFLEANVCDVFYEGKVYSIVEENVYSMEEKNE